MNILYAVLIGLGSTYVLWIFFLAVMSLKRALDAGLLTPTTKVLGYPVLYVGLLLDFFVNVFVMTPVLLEMPQETTVTARLKRHNQKSSGWRKAVAVWFEPILDPFDPELDHI
jgi:hypothetical protein